MKMKKIYTLTLAALLASAPTAVCNAAEDHTALPYNGAEGANVSEGYDNLFDCDITTKWCVTDFYQTETFVEWTQPSEGMNLSGLLLATANDNSLHEGRNPSKWQLSGKMKSSDEWEILAESTDTFSMEDVDYQVYKISFPQTIQPYNYYRFDILETTGANTLQISELHLCFEGKEDINLTAPIKEE